MPGHVDGPFQSQMLPCPHPACTGPQALVLCGNKWRIWLERRTERISFQQRWQKCVQLEGDYVGKPELHFTLICHLLYVVDEYICCVDTVRNEELGFLWKHILLSNLVAYDCKSLEKVLAELRSRTVLTTHNMLHHAVIGTEWRTGKPRRGSCQHDFPQTSTCATGQLPNPEERRSV